MPTELQTKLATGQPKIDADENIERAFSELAENLDRRDLLAEQRLLKAVGTFVEKRSGCQLFAQQRAQLFAADRRRERDRLRRHALVAFAHLERPCGDRIAELAVALIEHESVVRFTVCCFCFGHWRGSPW